MRAPVRGQRDFAHSEGRSGHAFAPARFRRPAHRGHPHLQTGAPLTPTVWPNPANTLSCPGESLDSTWNTVICPLMSRLVNRLSRAHCTAVAHATGYGLATGDRPIFSVSLLQAGERRLINPQLADN